MPAQACHVLTSIRGANHTHHNTLNQEPISQPWKMPKAINRGRTLSPAQKERQRINHKISAEARRQLKAGCDWQLGCGSLIENLTEKSEWSL